MPLNSNPIAATSTTTSGAATVTITGDKGFNYQVVNFSGASTDNYTVELKFGSTVAYTMLGLAKTLTDEDMHDWGPVAGTGNDLTVVTTPTSTGACTANLIYLITTI